MKYFIGGRQIEDALAKALAEGATRTEDRQSFIGGSWSKKSELLKLAKRGDKRPHRHSPLGIALCNYVGDGKAGRSCYDPNFAQEIRSLRPDWFVDLMVAQKKRRLLEMARDGSPRPVRNSPLEKALGHYIRPEEGSYDEQFCREVRSLRPDWFIEAVADGIALKKQQLLELARSGAPRPGRPDPLSGAISSYTCKGHDCYDGRFTRQIRAIRPDWFLKHSSSLKKEELLALAKSGAPRPSQKTSLGRCLANYLAAGFGGYDAQFTLKLRKLRPDWFRS